MKISLEQFDISEHSFEDSSKDIASCYIPKLLECMDDLFEFIEDDYSKSDTELKLRAIVNSIALKSFLKNSQRKMSDTLSYMLPRISEIMVIPGKNLNITLVQKQLVIFAPPMHRFKDVELFTSGLDDISNRSKGADNWIIDLSAVNHLPFELFGYLIGLKRELAKRKIELQLLWLKKEVIPAELKEAVISNFNLVGKGAFLVPN